MACIDLRPDLADPHVVQIRPVAPRIVQSMESGEDWRWCHVDETYV